MRPVDKPRARDFFRPPRLRPEVGPGRPPRLRARKSGLDKGARKKKTHVAQHWARDWRALALTKRTRTVSSIRPPQRAREPYNRQPGAHASVAAGIAKAARQPLRHAPPGAGEGGRTDSQFRHDSGLGQRTPRARPAARRRSQALTSAHTRACSGAGSDRWGRCSCSAGNGGRRPRNAHLASAGSGLSRAG